MANVIYQPSDLAGGKRTAFLEEARNGRARLRDKDGVGLVMLPEHDLAVLEGFAQWSRLSTHLEMLLGQDRAISHVELGELAWLRVFDPDDLRAFSEELQSALVAALADNDLAPVTDTVRDWQVTARQLDDPLRRSVLLSRHDPAEFDEVGKP